MKVSEFVVQRNTDAYTWPTRWVAKAKFSYDLSDITVDGSYVITYGWTRGQAQRRLQSIVVRLANKCGGIV